MHFGAFFVLEIRPAIHSIEAMQKTAWLFLPLVLIPFSAAAACFDEAASRYQIPSALLRSISRVESSGNPHALNRNADGSIDIGHMQINSRWLPSLARFGITQETLVDPCTNTMVGAWVLAQNIRRLGYSWDAVGAYNASSPEKRNKYARKVSGVLQRELSL